MEVMGRLDAVEKGLHNKKTEHKEEVECLNARISSLTLENQLLYDDNARLESIIDNNSSNTSNPPSADRKAGKPANTYNSRENRGRRAGGQKGHRGTTLTKADAEEKLRSGKYRHQIREIGSPSGVIYNLNQDDMVKGSGYITSQRCRSTEIKLGTVYAAEMGISFFLTFTGTHWRTRLSHCPIVCRCWVFFS